MKLATRLALAMVTLVLTMTAVLGTITYVNITNLVIPRALDRLQTQSQLNALRLQAAVSEGLNDVIALCESDGMREFVAWHSASVSNMNDAVTSEMRRRFEARFVGELKAIAAYQSIKIVGVADGGRDLIRVFRDDKDPTKIKIAAGDELHRRAGRDHFRDALQLSPSQVHVSDIRLQEDGAGHIVESHDPIIHIAKALFTEQGKPFGVVILNIDLRQELERIRAGMTHGNESFLIDADGNYLFHPDPQFMLGSRRVEPHRVYADFANFDEALAGAADGSGVWNDARGRKIAVGWTSIQLAQGPKIVAIEATEFSKLNVGWQAVQISTLVGGSIAVMAAILLAILFSRSLAKPLVEMAKDVREFSAGKRLIERRHGGSEEISVLSSAFAQMMTEIRQKNELLRSTIDSIGDPILVGDKDGNILLANDAARQLLGVVAGECSVSGRKSFELFLPDGSTPLPFNEGAMAHALKGEPSNDLSIVVQTSDRRFDAKVSGRPLCENCGKIVGAVVVYRDVSESNRAVAALIASERSAQMIVETALDAFTQVDASGTIIEWSPKAEEMLGWSRIEAIGRNVRDTIVPARNRNDNRERLAQFLIDVDSGASGWRYVAPSLRRDGTEIITEVSLTALRHQDGMIINAFLRDITKQREAELQLQQAQKLESIGQLTGGIAHDFNNLLTVITGTIELLADGVRQSPDLGAIVKMIDEAAARGAKLTASLLAFARKQPLEPKSVDTNVLILGVCKLLEPTLGRNIKITTELADQTYLVRADANQLSTALLNLAINARDAMPDGGDLHFKTTNAEIETPPRNSGLQAGEYITIEVTDTGSGIPADIRDKIFEPFFTTKEPGKGTGLGLSMVYGFAKQSGGHIEVASTEGVGSTFTIYLPKATESHDVVRRAPTESPDKGTETILCVEDDKAVRLNAIKLLEGLGYTVLSAENADQALAIEQSGRHFDLLFTDIMMPGRMNGFQLASEILSRRPDLRVLYTSGFDDGTIARYGRFTKGKLLLAKPYRRTELATKLRDALHSTGVSVHNLAVFKPKNEATAS